MQTTVFDFANGDYFLKHRKMLPDNWFDAEASVATRRAVKGVPDTAV